MQIVGWTTLNLLLQTFEEKHHQLLNYPLFHRLGGAIKRGCVEIFSFIFPPYYMTSENINIFTGYVVSRKNIDIFTGVANTP